MHAWACVAIVDCICTGGAVVAKSTIASTSIAGKSNTGPVVEAGALIADGGIQIAKAPRIARSARAREVVEDVGARGPHETRIRRAEIVECLTIGTVVSCGTCALVRARSNHIARATILAGLRGTEIDPGRTRGAGEASSTGAVVATRHKGVARATVLAGSRQTCRIGGARRARESRGAGASVAIKVARTCAAIEARVAGAEVDLRRTCGACIGCCAVAGEGGTSIGARSAILARIRATINVGRAVVAGSSISSAARARVRTSNICTVASIAAWIGRKTFVNVLAGSTHSSTAYWDIAIGACGHARRC